MIDSQSFQKFKYGYLWKQYYRPFLEYYYFSFPGLKILQQ